VDDVDEEDVLIDLEDIGSVSEDGPISEQELASLPYVVETDPKNDGDRIGLTCFREICTGCPALCADRGVDVTRRSVSGLRVVPSVRQSFCVPDGFTMVSCDYNSQELVIAANLSKEPKWVKALGGGEDLHAITAAGAYGHTIDEFLALPKPEKKRKRDVGKMLNFATLYGATARTLATRANIDPTDAEKIYEGFRDTYQGLFGWIREVHHWARVHGYTTTYFGRKRWLKQFYDMNDKQQASFADRSSVNTAIQGTGADVTRIAMVKAWNNFRTEGITRNDAYCVMQVHDELSFAIRPEVMEDVMPVIKKSMEFNVKGWDVQLTVGTKVGKIWGAQEGV
jgi:DNA polymerase-1